MRGRNIFLGAMILLCGLFLLRLFFIPQPVVAFNPDNLLLQQTAVRPPGGITPE